MNPVALESNLSLKSSGQGDSAKAFLQHLGLHQPRHIREVFRRSTGVPVGEDCMSLSKTRLFNTISRRLESFEPDSGVDSSGRPQVTFYCCGPTVYDFGHIGNFRTFVQSDLLRRHLEFRGFAVRHVMNVTDVEDKIIHRVRESGQSLAEFTRRYESEFISDLRTLNCLPPTVMPRATEYIPQIVELISRLEKRGLAYRARDGSVYFSIQRYRDCGCRYGQLVNINPEELRVGERVAKDEYDKQSVADFALWKARVPEDGDVFWESPWGRGRPGWHIECSAMSMALLGPSFDLHAGGEDLVFPHHEDEIAQSEGAGLQQPGRPFVRHWFHVAHLLVDGRKMSKSLGNFFTIRDLLAQGFTGREIRHLLLAAHYRETFNFTTDGLVGSRAALGRLDECVGKLAAVAGKETWTGPTVSPSMTEFIAAMDDDLGVSRAWAVVFDWVREQNRLLSSNRVSARDAAEALAFWRVVNRVFGLGEKPGDDVPAEVLRIAQERLEAKRAKDFSRADALRKQLGDLGWAVEDTPAGPKFRRN